jgi:hypothetical protein
MQKACKGFICTDLMKPFVDYDGEKCFCRAHPCWDDNGQLHTCDEGEYPYLAWGYSANGTLQCSCWKWPQIGSVYVSETLCPGEHCDTKMYPILDYEEKTGKCECVPNPCTVAGRTHQCSQEKYPILHFTYSKDGNLQCGCRKKYVPHGHETQRKEGEL